MNEHIIQIQNVSKKYGFKEALLPFDLMVPKGGIVGLIGPNGSGKSTLLKMIAGLVHPSTGEIIVDGTRVRDRLINRKVVYLSEVDHLYPFYNVKETLEFANIVFPDFDVKKALEIQKMLNLDSYTKVKSLSKGNKARLKIILAMARKVPVVLLDEPLSGLDPLVREDIIKLIASYGGTTEQTMIISTHEVSEIEPMLDYVILLKYSKMAYFDKVETLREEYGQSVLDKLKEVLA
ncbi:ABC transporter ATP-binding protein [Caldalkalibacillus mannanilyticus]|uniref:ABC transporter ATP-binding protein n=1 Tax=Caldalkalibacillus mannanilyticus TaxID=1418 RepID=UPI000467EE9B|nr:ABC transporter ATP-binding protein [Caldalkalibacillus mannanilyticus]